MRGNKWQESVDITNIATIPGSLLSCRVLMLCWDDRENLEILKNLIEHQDASAATLYETALVISNSTRMNYLEYPLQS